MAVVQVQLPLDRIADFCRRWRVAEFSLFGSVLLDDFRPDSDIDVLVEFGPDAAWSTFDWVEMKDELERMFGRRVDLVSKRGLRNPFRRHAILSNREVIYAASKARHGK